MSPLTPGDAAKVFWWREQMTAALNACATRPLQLNDVVHFVWTTRPTLELKLAQVREVSECGQRYTLRVTPCISRARVDARSRCNPCRPTHLQF